MLEVQDFSNNQRGAYSFVYQCIIHCCLRKNTQAIWCKVLIIKAESATRVLDVRSEGGQKMPQLERVGAV